ncbi:hypothetical protein ACW9KT_21855 [Hymenobacter sp. HD11105]
MAKNKKQPKRTLDLQGWLGVALILLLGGYFLRTCTRGYWESRALARGTFTTRAVIINQKNYFGNSPVSQQVAYSYQFVLQGKSYEGNSRDPDLQVGDSIWIEYVPENPAYHQVHHDSE